MTNQPQWLEKIGNLGINMWTLHTVSTDATTVVIQLLIGVMLLVGNDGLIAKAGLNLSVVWGLFVWVIAEGMGGIFVSGATLLNGMPGAVIFYVIGAVVILRVKDEKFKDGTFGKLIWNLIGLLFLVGTVMQLLPAEGFFKAGNLAQIFQNSAANSQPEILKAPMDFLTTFATSHYFVLNVIISVVFFITALGLLSGKKKKFWLYFVSAVLFFMWWFGMDFGVIGGVGTDPNSAPLIFLYLYIAYKSVLSGLKVQAVVSLQNPDILQNTDILKKHSTVGGSNSIENLVDETASKLNPNLQDINAEPTLATKKFVLPYRVIVSAWLTLSLVIATVWIMIPDLSSINEAMSTPQVETAALVDSGGLAQVPGNPMSPNFTLINQRGQKTSLRQFRNKVVILSFLDPVCYETCPVVAEEFIQTAKMLRNKSSKLEFVAVNANPYFVSLTATRSFDSEHGLSNLTNWEFLTGSKTQLEHVWELYGAVTEVPQVGMVAHSLLVYMINPEGKESEITQATGNPGTNLEISYAQMFANEAGRLMGRG